jgi:type VI secretion system secreted protein VgrG
MQTGKVTLLDYHFETPKKDLTAEALSRINLDASKELEFYDFPSGAARKFDDGASGVFGDNQTTTKIRMEEIDAQHKTFSGISDCCALTAGYRFELEDHPIGEFNAQHTLISVNHEIEQSPDYLSDEEVSNSYSNSFKCISNTVTFRPPQVTPKPILHGSQTAFVVGPAGEEIYTDKYGRVKVQFNWDRQGKYDANSSCWVRVAQAWAGKKWGMMFIPRIGMEVIVEFFEGDPDQPVITGCVYNAEAMPAYTLPDEKSKSGIKTDSTKGGGGFNELRFEDKKGSEQVFIHGEKDIDLRVKKDSREHIGNERHLIVIKDKLEKIGGDKHLQVLGDKNEKVTGTVSLNAGQDLHEKVGMNYALQAGTEVHIKAGMNMVLESGTNLTLKVGGNFININPAGVFIKGTMVFINSGGSAGSGGGAKPDAPKDPKEADKAEAGQKIALPPPKPPPKPVTYSPAALVMMAAAKVGTAFCDI